MSEKLTNEDVWNLKMRSCLIERKGKMGKCLRGKAFDCDGKELKRVEGNWYDDGRDKRGEPLSWTAEWTLTRR